MSQDASDTLHAITSASFSIAGAIVANSQHFLPVVQFLAACMGICAGIVTVILTTLKIRRDWRNDKRGR